MRNSNNTHVKHEYANFCSDASQVINPIYDKLKNVASAIGLNAELVLEGGNDDYLARLTLAF